jgi:hypothetical protein
MFTMVRDPVGFGDIQKSHSFQRRTHPVRGENMIMRIRQVLQLTAALGATAALTAFPTTTAAAAPADLSTAAVTLGQTCTGPFGNVFAFTLNAATAVPAGSTWSITASRSAAPWSLHVSSSNPVVQTSSASPTRVNLSAPAGVPAGTVVTLTPSYFTVPVSSPANVLTFSGYGGSTSASFTTSNRPC